jgi:hypothetical protein
LKAILAVASILTSQVPAFATPDNKLRLMLANKKIILKFDIIFKSFLFEN